MHAEGLYSSRAGLAPAVGVRGFPLRIVGNGLDRSVKFYQTQTGEHSSPLPIVGNNLCVVPKNQRIKNSRIAFFVNPAVFSCWNY